MKKQIGNYTIEVSHDPFNDNPRITQDNVGTMVCFHRRYNLGDDGHGIDHESYSGWTEMENDIRQTMDIAAILPLFLYDHSGTTMNTTGFSCKWDSGQVGFIFATKQRAKEFGVMPHLVEDVLSLEVDEYDRYLRGEFYRLKITDEEGDEVDSCSGFGSEDEAMKSAEDYVNQLIKRQNETTIIAS
jgi:hypothetical protein